MKHLKEWYHAIEHSPHSITLLNYMLLAFTGMWIYLYVRTGECFPPWLMILAYGSYAVLLPANYVLKCLKAGRRQ